MDIKLNKEIAPVDYKELEIMDNKQNLKLIKSIIYIQILIIDMFIKHWYFFFIFTLICCKFMTKKFKNKKIINSVCVIFILLFCNLAFSSLDNVNGDWAGTNCDSYADNSLYGTYNWKFFGNTVQTYLQYHADRYCNKPASKSNQAYGTYNYIDNKLIINFNHLNYPLTYHATISNSNLYLKDTATGREIHLKKIS